MSKPFSGADIENGADGKKIPKKRKTGNLKISKKISKKRKTGNLKKIFRHKIVKQSALYQ